jgi:hypothetical protein
MRLRFFHVFFALIGSVVLAEDGSNEFKTIAKIELLGGHVTRDESLPGNPVVEVCFKKNKRFNEKYLPLLNSLPHMRSLDLSGVEISDAGLKKIGEFTNLSRLRLCGREITDQGLMSLHELTNLRELTLDGTQATWVGLSDLRESLPALRVSTAKRKTLLAPRNIAFDVF